MNQRVLAIVVCYNPDISSFKQSLTAIVEQGCDVLLVDNASSNVSDIRALSDLFSNVELLALPRNSGLGAAHNKGIKIAQQRAYHFVLLFDQDSVPLDNMLMSLLHAHQSVQEQESVPISAVGARYLNVDNGGTSFFVRFGKAKFQRQYCDKQTPYVKADFLISSGSLLSLAAIEKVGNMDESLFIDHVDTEWFLRAKSLGMQAYGVCDAVMQHGLGEQTHQVTLGGRKRNVPQHKPFRYYYIFRNSVLLYKRRYTSVLWKWNDLQRLFMILLMFGLLTAPRWRNLSMMLKGVWHGLRGVHGELVDELGRN